MATAYHTFERTAESVPTSITFKRSYPSKYGGDIYLYDIEFEDGTTGEFSTTKGPEEQDKFVIGKRVTYGADPAEDKRGNSYTKIDIYHKDKPATGYGGRGGGRGTGKSWGSEESIVASVCLDCANIIVEKQNLQENVNPDLRTLHALADKFYKYIMEKAGSDV